MPTPKHNTPPAGTRPDTHAPLTRRASTDVTSTGPAGPAATQRAAVWFGCHLGEVVAIAVTGSLAVTVTVWFAAITVLVALVWATHELRVDRAARTAKTTDETRDGGEQA
ncbi:hypothetical protein OG738_13515 [Amycolatopsis sp. NBC_01488]|uniref:hypothetical protein n=1 Tax=Amycolatopsis sp. NBC_01488 TaxID=2903563 RepID=UPI002E2CC584|nr:hypothetical protein [Amycolatopsis sp. NBC_01488]